MSSAARPVITVVTVCFNSAAHLAEAMESVLAQTYPHYEYIVVDGGSTDGTLDIIERVAPAFGDRLHWISEPDAGIYDAMNKGIAMATGDLIGLLNSDDAYVPDALQRIAEAYEAQPDAGAIYGDVEIMDVDGRSLRVEHAADVAPGARPDWLPMCHQSLFVARRIYDEVGTFDTSYRILADYEWLLRALARGVTFLRIDGPVARFRLGGACNTNTARSTAERERIRVAYGANPLTERIRRIRHAVNRLVYPVVGRFVRRKRP